MLWQKTWKRIAARPLISSVLALALLAPVAGYEMAHPLSARAAMSPAAAASAPLDEQSVSALTALDRAMETLAARVTPAVVNVAVTAKVKAAAMSPAQDMDPFFQQFFGGRGMRQQPQVEHGIGSGFVISPDGYIVTNNHVVEDATDIRVTFSDKRVMPAKLVGRDPLTDLAVIKVEGNNFVSVPWGDSKKLHPGQSVLAFGNPLGYRFSVTRGIVSALDRPNPEGDPRKPGEFIQTDAAINRGNSGGPLVTARGQVVGINTFLISATGGFAGLGFAIPTQVARPVVESLIKFGKVEHSHIGVSINDVTPANARFFHLDEASGAVISQVEPGTPGEKAGLKVGDVITGVDGQKVESSGELQTLISNQQPGTRVELQVMRDGKTMSVPLTLEAMDAKEDMTASSGPERRGRWGVGLTDISPDAREQLQIPGEVKGALVGQVEPGSPADDAGLSRGDVIQQVNRKSTPTLDDVKSALASVPKGQDALVLVWSNGGSTFRVLHAPSDVS